MAGAFCLPAMPPTASKTSTWGSCLPMLRSTGAKTTQDGIETRTPTPLPPPPLMGKVFPTPSLLPHVPSKAGPYRYARYVGRSYLLRLQTSRGGGIYPLSALSYGQARRSNQRPDQKRGHHPRPGGGASCHYKTSERTSRPLPVLSYNNRHGATIKTKQKKEDTVCKKASTVQNARSKTRTKTRSKRGHHRRPWLAPQPSLHRQRRQSTPPPTSTATPTSNPNPARPVASTAKNIHLCTLETPTPRVAATSVEPVGSLYLYHRNLRPHGSSVEKNISHGASRALEIGEGRECGWAGVMGGGWHGAGAVR